MSSLSVAIVTYRTPPALLRRALDSLAAALEAARAQALLDHAQVFVIDNGDTPEVAQAIDGSRIALPAIELLRGQGNVGYARANNLVLDRLRSDVHLVMNPDVELAADSLAEGLKAFATHPEVGMVAPAVFDADGTRQYLCKRYPSAFVLFLRGFAPTALQRPFANALASYEMRDVIADRFVQDVPLASGCFMLVRTALFKRLNGFDARFFLYFEDYDLSVRLAHEARIAYVPTVRIVHHGGEASRKGLRHVAMFMSSARRFFSRHGWKIV